MTAEPAERWTAEDIARLVDQASIGADDARDVSTGLRAAFGDAADTEQVADERQSVVQWTIWAFEFHRKRDGQGQGEYFVPWMVFSDGTASIPFLKDVSDACVAWWAELAGLVTHDRAVARLEHLLVERRHGNVGQRARRAAEGYLGLADAPSLDAVEAVRTALDLALRTRQVGTAGDVLDRAAALAWQALQEDRPALGVVLGFVDVLIGQGDTDHDVAAMLERARALYRGRPHQEDSVIQRQLALAKAQPEASRQLWSDRVDVWIAAGEAVEPLVRVAYLQTAVEHARTSGDRELVERATVKLQAMRLETLGLTTFSVETARPRGELERMLRPITDADDWREALVRFARFGPATGDLERNRQLRDELSREFVLSQLFPPMQLGGDNLPRFQASSPEEQDEYRLVQHELHHMQLFSPVLLEALVRVIARHPIPSVAELTDHFCVNSVIPYHLGAGIGRAFARFWAGDTEGAAFTITPRIEALARNLLIESDAGIYRVQRNQAPGQYPGLWFLLDKLLGLGMDPSWHRFVLVLCAHTVGTNLRNELAHGFVDRIGETGTALLLQAAAYLASLTPTQLASTS